MSQQLLREIEKQYLKADVPAMFPGDTVKVNVRIREGNKERIQAFEGIVIRNSGGGTSQTVVIRKVFQGVGVERIFLIHSPQVESFKVIRRGRVRQARLYYMRGRTGKAARIREKVGALLAEKKAAAAASSAN
jgi:large subunit ribosomal protein L19